MISIRDIIKKENRPVKHIAKDIGVNPLVIHDILNKVNKMYSARSAMLICKHYGVEQKDVKEFKKVWGKSIERVKRKMPKHYNTKEKEHKKVKLEPSFPKDKKEVVKKKCCNTSCDLNENGKCGSNPVNAGESCISYNIKIPRKFINKFAIMPINTEATLGYIERGNSL